MTFQELKNNEDNIRKLTEDVIYFNDNVKYTLSGIISCHYDGHFTSIILNYNGDEYENLLIKNKSYYHDDVSNEGYFQEINGNALSEIKDIPYILIYKRNYI